MSLMVCTLKQDYSSVIFSFALLPNKTEEEDCQQMAASPVIFKRTGHQVTSGAAAVHCLKIRLFETRWLKVFSRNVCDKDKPSNVWNILSNYQYIVRLHFLKISLWQCFSIPALCTAYFGHSLFQDTWFRWSAGHEALQITTQLFGSGVLEQETSKTSTVTQQEMSLVLCSF